MTDYNYELKIKEYNIKGIKEQRKTKVPIKTIINNTKYIKEQFEFIKSLYPNGIIKKQIKLKDKEII